MKRTILIALGSALAVLALAAPAGARTGAEAVPMPGTCVSTMDRSIHNGTTSSPGWDQGDWEVNTGSGHCGDSFRIKVRCWDGVSSPGYTSYSGTVVKDELNNRAVCQGPQQYVKYGKIQFNGGAWIGFEPCSGCQPGAVSHTQALLGRKLPA